MTKAAREDRWLYLECYSGISGDMTVGALLDLGADRERLEKALSSLGADGYHLHFGRTKKCGIDAYDFDVHLEDGKDGEEGQEHSHDGVHEHGHAHACGEAHTHVHDGAHEYAHACDEGHTHVRDGVHERGHAHACGEAHAHVHDHAHPHIHRNIKDIFALLDRMDEEEPVRALAKKMFTVVAEAESKAHGIPVEEVHFHEVGAIDSIVDIVGAAVCFCDLGVTRVAVSPLSEGSGYVRCQHGVMPVPVPATANIAAACGLELKLTDNEGEMVTPTGAAIAAALRTEKRLPEHYTIERIGLGAGKKDFKNANILRAMLIRPSQANGDNVWAQEDETLTGALRVLETNLDDCTGEALGFVTECLLEKGALDVWYTPAYMKKNRPAYVLHVLCSAERTEDMEALIFAHTTTIGIRRYPVFRTVLDREVREVETRYGAARVKYCTGGGQTYTYPEYESVRQICRERGLGFTETYHDIKEDGQQALGTDEED